MSETMTRVELQTSMGNIVVCLYNETPKHRDNFVKLVKDGYYDGVLFHRVIKDFMIQTGDGDSRTATADQMLGSGDPGYTIEAEIVYPQYFHKRGALAAARTADQVNPERRSSGSQFYIVTGKAYDSTQVKQLEDNMANMKKEGIFRRLVGERRATIQQLQQQGDQQALMNLQNELIALTEQEYAANPASLTQEQIKAYTTVGGTPHLDGQYTVFGEV
ncbi:MAG: peptidylprolyl isomerase, partial [Muribaculaceae bacterium]|nr:peptidylprolyl isomerase [Muribaculaceae bacterium]